MNKVQVIKCKCGSIIAGCMEPDCYEDSDWQRDMRKYVRKGYTVGVVECANIKLERCKCKEVKNKEKSESQLSLF